MISWQQEPVILASASATRQAMLNAAGIRFDVSTSAVDETLIKQDLRAQQAEPRAVALALATAKAEAVSADYPEAWVLGGDSVVSVDGTMFSKPRSREDAATHLRAFSGRMMTLDSAVVLARGGTRIDYASDDAHLEVRILSDAFIAAYLDSEWPAISACVGCFRIEGLGVHLFERTAGSHFTILGMPLLPVLDMLRTHGLITP
jgi:septum formation protein